MSSFSLTPNSMEPILKKKKYALQEQHNVVSIVEPAVHHENKLLTDHFYA